MAALRLHHCQALIFDLDGTLADTMGDFVAVLQQCLAEMRLDPLDDSQVRRMVGKGSEHLIRSVLALRVPGWARMSDDEQRGHFEQATALYEKHYQRTNGTHTQLFPDALAVLHTLHQMGIPLACLTNKPGKFAQPLLQHLGIAPYFQFVYGGDAFSQKKPHPLPLLKTCESLGTAPGCTWMVGDSINDAQAARAAGCPVALVTYGYNHGEPITQAPHDLLMDSLADLLN